MKELTIGTVAKRVGLNARTIRYYERVGLLSPARSESGGSSHSPGYRLFSAAEIEKLAFIKKARSLGFPIKEIKELSTLVGNGKRPSPALARLLESKLREVREQAKMLDTLLGSLRTLLNRAREQDQKKPLSLPAVQQCCEPLCGPEICR